MTTGYLFEPDADAKRRELSRWFTPRHLAERVVRWADVAGKTVLEPSAGTGALVEPAIAAGATVTAYEIDPATAEALRRSCPSAEVFCADFLGCAYPGRRQIGLINPPYEDGQDVAFVAKAAQCCDVVFAILRLDALAGIKRHTRLWSWVTVHRIAILKRRPRFGGSFNPMVDFCVVMLSASTANTKRPILEWW